MISQNRIYHTTFIILVLISACTTQKPPPLPLATCDDSTIQSAFSQLAEYEPTSDESYIRLENNQFVIDDEPFIARGINYYPSRSPWRRFFSHTDMDTLRTEFTLMHDAGFNTLRIFLWHEALFQCEGDGAIPQPQAFQLLDTLIHESASYGFKLIVTLNDLPDLTNYPLYDNPAHTQAQTAYIVSRYQDEPAILAWDVRNEGDIDYGSQGMLNPPFSRDTVLSWLNETSQAVRAIDSNHLITAGWLHDAQSTAPDVDFISFHHWWNGDDLSARIRAIHEQTDKPILLEEVGYSTKTMTDDEQANEFAEVLQTAHDENLLGWLIWTAFDFPRTATCLPEPCESVDNLEHYFGIWRTDYTPKPSLSVIQQFTTEE